MTKTILTFGDSNTYGTPPMGSRDYHPRFAARWPAVMAQQTSATLIEEGLPARTTDRVQEVLNNVRNDATAKGLDPDLVANIWTTLIEWSIAREATHLGHGTLR